MDSIFLEKGDIFRLERGMSVSALIPTLFFHPEAPFKPGKGLVDITVGQILPSALFYKKENMLACIKRTLRDFYLEVPDEKIVSFIDSFDISFSSETYDTGVFEGNYSVTQVRNYFSPDIRNVYSVKTDNSAHVISFFQSSRVVVASSGFQFPSDIQLLKS